MRICLLRHGETDWNSSGRWQGREDIPLNMTGLEQVREAAAYLKRFNWAAIITSPLIRARKSAEIIRAETGNTALYEEADLAERDLGKASGMTPAERTAAFPEGNYPGMEPLEALQTRALNALQKYVKKFEGKDFIIVSHGGTINSILACLSGREIGTGKTILKNACMSLLEKTGGKINVLYFNKTADELAPV